MKVTFFGSSDDNFCVKGDDNDEWSAYKRPRRVRTDTGLVVEGEYSPEGYSGKWSVKVVGDIPAGHTAVRRPATDQRGNYSDEVTIEGPFKRLIAVKTADEICEELVDFDWDDLSDEQRTKVAEIIGIQ